ncbi:MAG: TIGR04053 family radical SAM/SPASM domain-containing protein [Desulfurococcales archaeon]|nr:TIGR04053 family radical SAM/SPASM domain-containing protein [Desulfurococcales archaeon]
MSWPAQEKPLLVFWETTKACMLSCKHCRAEAIKNPLPGELDTDEAFKLIDMITEFSRPYPILVLTGGDPLMRKDIKEIIEYGVNKKVKTALSPAVTELLEQSINWIVKSGVNAVSISIDSASPHIHDEIRGVPGVWRKSIMVIRELLNKGVNVQINSVVMNSTKEGLADLFALVKKLGINVWEVFYLVPTGRASFEEMLSPRDWEDISHFLYEASKYSVIIRTTEGPMYRRVTWIRSKLEEYGYNPDELLGTGEVYTRLVRRLRSILGKPSSKPNIPRMFTRDGLGIVFVSYDGNVYPSGFLKLSAGNVRSRSLSDIYRNSRIFKLLREAMFKGRCGECEFRNICGGSRARAFSVYGDPFESDPACDYKPGEYSELVNKLGLNEALP